MPLRASQSTGFAPRQLSGGSVASGSHHRVRDSGAEFSLRVVNGTKTLAAQGLLASETGEEAI